MPIIAIITCTTLQVMKNISVQLKCNKILFILLQTHAHSYPYLLSTLNSKVPTSSHMCVTSSAKFFQNKRFQKNMRS